MNGLRPELLSLVGAAPAPSLSDPAPLYYAAVVLVIGVIGVLEALLAYLVASKLSKRAAALATSLIIACNIGALAWLRPERHEMVVAVLAGTFLVASIILGWTRGHQPRTGRVRLLAWASTIVLVSVPLIAWTKPDILESFARSRTYEAHEKARLESEEASAQQCIGELAKRDPKTDAEQDFARGDATPIGLTYTPHDPPSPTSEYPLACKHEYDGEYQRTGKWFGYTSDGYSTFGRPRSYNTCRREARDYAVRYNRRMVELAPGTVREFCRSQKLAESVRLATASIAVLGTVGGKQEIIDGTTYQTAGRRIAETNLGPVLVTYSYPPDVDQYYLYCPLDLGVANLKEKGQLIEAKRRWPLLLKADSTAKRIAADCGWSMSRTNRLTSNTALEVRERRTDGGRQCWWETIIELRPEGPVQRGTVFLGASDKRPGQLRYPRGELENLVRDESFDVVVPRTNIREHYEMRDGRFVGPKESKLKC